MNDEGFLCPPLAEELKIAFKKAQNVILCLNSSATADTTIFHLSSLIVHQNNFFYKLRASLKEKP